MFEVTRLEDGTFDIPADAFLYVGDEAEGARLRAEKAGAGTPIPISCFLLRGGAEVILIDCGAGSAMGGRFGQARAAMAAADIPPEAVDRVILTHIHFDHAMGLVEADAAYFPRARISWPATEYDYFTDEAARAAEPEDRRYVFDIAQTLVKLYAGRIDRFTTAEVVPGVTALPLPGHTLGHTGYRVATPEGDVLLWGDTAHLADVQPADPRIGLIYDRDPEQAHRTREAALALAAAEGLRVGGGHLTGLLRVLAHAGAYRLEV